MKKFDWNSPMTRKDYAVLCGGSLAFAIAIYAVVGVVTFWDEITDWIDRKRNGDISK